MESLIAFLVMNLVGLAHADQKNFDASGITRIEVNNGSGDLKITATNSSKISVNANKKQFGENCRLTMEKRDSTLFIQVEKSSLFKPACEVDFEVSAPKKALLDLDLGSGDIHVRGTTGDINFRIGHGQVNVDAQVKRLNGKTGSGDISIKGLTEGGSLDTGAGKVNLVYTVAPILGNLDIRVGSGDTVIVLPKSTKAKTSFSAGMGELTNELGDTPDSQFRISLKAGAGDLHIKKQ